MTNLFLFDIDGTLVWINDIHRDSYRLDYQRAFQRHVSDDILIPIEGKSERGTHEAILEELGIPHTEDLLNQLMDVHISNFVEALGNVQKIEPLDGVLDFLRFLKSKGDYLGAFTGNLKEPGELILEKTDLKDFFSIMSYADGKKEKEQIVQHAIEQAERKKYDFNRVVIIGDTIYDMKAGNDLKEKYLERYKIFVVGVATSSNDPNTLEQRIYALQEKNPDIVVPSLKYYQRILEKLNK